MIDLGKLSVLGVRVDAVDYAAATDRVISAAVARRPFAASALAVHGIMTGVADAEHRYRLNSLDMIVPDGQPVRWALNLLHQTNLADRVYGPELTLRVCERAASSGDLPIFLYGSRPEVLSRLSRNLTDRFEGLKIAGVRPSLFRKTDASEKERIVEEIKASGARIVFVGLGCPRQEVWAYEYREELRMPIIAVGAAFDFHAGLLPQAPKALQRMGLEWLFRLMQEPRRLWRRYLLLNPWFLWSLAQQKAGLKAFDSSDVSRPDRSLDYG